MRIFTVFNLNNYTFEVGAVILVFPYIRHLNFTLSTQLHNRIQKSKQRPSKVFGHRKIGKYY